jgi:hypothetical protein
MRPSRRLDVPNAFVQQVRACVRLDRLVAETSLHRAAGAPPNRRPVLA